MQRRLGRGLESLLGAGVPDTGVAAGKTAGGGVLKVAVDLIRANPAQPRVGFHEQEMSELEHSVREVGVLQPLLVRRAGAGYELIAGERRLRAARAAGLTSVPVVERETTDDEMLTLALVENLQRADLNPIEKARSFRNLMERFGLTQEEVARRIGKDRSTVANFIRLLDLPESVQHVVSRGTISMGHARALLGLPHASAQQALALRVEEEGLSVRETERIVARGRERAGDERATKPPQRKDPYVRQLEDRIRERLAAKVAVQYKDGRGKIAIIFYSDDDLQRILDALGISE